MLPPLSKATATRKPCKKLQTEEEQPGGTSKNTNEGASTVPILVLRADQVQVISIGQQNHQTQHTIGAF